MTDPLHDLTDAHLQAALDAAGCGRICIPKLVREDMVGWRAVIAHARQIAANEKLAAELAELRAKYEPEPVDPVKVEADRISNAWHNTTTVWELPTFAEACIRRGTEMQPAPFTREEAERIAYRVGAGSDLTYLSYISNTITALTTPHAELRAMLGDG